MCENSSQQDCPDKKVIRSLWEHEDNLINHRMTWLGVSQGLLFAAYGLSIKFSLDGVTNKKMADDLTNMIPYLGLATSILIFIGILAAILSMRAIKADCKLKKREITIELGVTDETTRMGWCCAGGMPIIFIVAWSYVLLSGFIFA